MSRSLKVRPSEVVGVLGFPGFCLDEAVVLWGTSFDAALQEAADGAKDAKAAATARGRVLRAWLPSGAAQYRDPGK
jgi:hypothetical protein